jgi:hypothetical protein
MGGSKNSHSQKQLKNTIAEQTSTLYFCFAK